MLMNNKIKNIPLDDKIFYIVVYVVLSIALVVTLVPLINIVAASFSAPSAVSAGKVLLWPVDFSIEGYKAVFKNGDVIMGYANTIFYTVVGTLINVVLTVLAAYPLSRKDLVGRGFLMKVFSFTMIFTGGMIPTYLLVSELGMINTRWALLLPGAISVYNMIITRTYFQNNLPDELWEAAQLDGCGNFKFFIKMAIPLSGAIIAVISLYYAVAHWNAYFNAFLYINDRNLYPLQIFLREILIANSIDPNAVVDPETAEAKQGMADLLKYSLIMVSCVPIWCVYPFVQKYFVKGVMVGSVKG